MGTISGERSVEIDAPVERCYEIASDIATAPEWQGSLKDVEVLERDGQKRATLAETESDAKVKTVRATLRFSYDEPTAIRWVQEKGETKSLTGSWTFEDLGEGRTRATYALEADPGRMLGMLLRGPAETKVRDFLLGDAAEDQTSRTWRRSSGWRESSRTSRGPTSSSRTPVSASIASMGATARRSATLTPSRRRSTW
jgi:uncharacterized membrane protein